MQSNTEATHLRIFHRKPAVLEATGWCTSTLYQKIKNGLFIAPIKPGLMTSVWPSDELRKLQDAFIAGKSEQEIRALVAELHAARKVGA